ncbi:IS607 family element RNA-guided endonuclease TnpB [Bifidobacterium longum]|uniref:IS607 family element RNA-guided endonuclease TnpB n=2 Tax=Bifidobacterium longum TaxID=216816 RepID=UPI002023EAEF|nr:IS607 family element RNA-guided endonuclease TnpB [Bifidobacterium longum]MDW3108320.1 IS607 family element RNA-guided endonuclease TnpB [Bifidobacterium longum]
MLEAVKVALDPTPRQERLLESHAGAARFAYNKGLARVRDMLERGDEPEWSYYGLRRWWNQAKDTLAVDEATGEPWWPENSKEAYNSGLESLADALRNFSKSRKGRRKGRRMGFPRFKSKDRAVPGFAYTTGSFGIIDCDPYALKLPRIGRVHCMEDASRRVDGAKVLRMSVSRRGGRWQASLTVERADLPVPSPPKGGSVGIDLGVKELATLSDGTVVHNPRALDSNLKRLRRAQKDLSRKAKGSNRRHRARTKVSHLHARVANLRHDMLDKTTTMLARTYADISIEDLNVAGMVKNHRLARVVEDAAFAEFRRQLEYKTARTGARLHVIDRWYPSSKTCSNCGTVKAKLSLSERVYHCEECGLVIDRDLNAAINIQVAGSAPETLNARGGSGRRADASRRATRHPVKREPSDGVSRVRLGAGLGNEAMQMTSL